MRATSPPAALTVADAAIPLVVAVLVPLAAPSAALAERWLRPVPGEVARPFDYARTAPFARGAHRGADLAARPGTTVRAACGGRVVHAGPVAGRDGVVSVRCGTRRVSYLPLDAITVRAGAAVRAGAPLGAVATGHGGLHVGVRREGDAFGYEDPLQRLPAAAEPSVPVAVTRPRPAGPRRPRLEPARRLRPPRPRLEPERRLRPPRPRLEPARLARPRRTLPPARPAPWRWTRAAAPHTGTPTAVRATGAPAPWPVWLGLALLACGAAGSRTIVRRRRDAAQSARPALEVPR